MGRKSKQKKAKKASARTAAKEEPLFSGEFSALSAATPATRRVVEEATRRVLEDAPHGSAAFANYVKLSLHEILLGMRQRAGSQADIDGGILFDDEDDGTSIIGEIRDATVTTWEQQTDAYKARGRGTGIPELQRWRKTHRRLTATFPPQLEMTRQRGLLRVGSHRGETC
jgi:hypothetical protein